MTGGFQLRRDEPLACTGSEINLTFDVPDRDEGGYFSLTEPGRIVIPETGWYAFFLACKYAAPGTHDWHQGNNAYLRVNEGSAYYNHGLGYNIMPFIDRSSVSAMLFLQAGDVVEPYCLSGETGATVQAIFTGYFLGEALPIGG